LDLISLPLIVDLPGIVINHNGDQPSRYWNHVGPRAIAGFDCGFTSGGDDNSLCIGYVGRDIHGQVQLACETDTYSINPITSSREEYRKAVAEQVIKICREKLVQPNDFYMDISNDGGLMMREINNQWQTNKIQGISSLEQPEDKIHYKNRVTELWFQVLNVITMGIVRV